MAASLLRALASRPRLMLLCNLIGGEQSVGQLAEKTGMRMPTVSQNLALLRAERLVAQRREGTTIHYRLVNDTAKELIAVLYRAFCEDGAKPKRHKQRMPKAPASRG